MGKIKTYNPKEVTMAFGSHIVSGYADDSFITIDPAGDGVTKKVGCDGEIVRSISPDDTKPCFEIAFRQLSGRLLGCSQTGGKRNGCDIPGNGITVFIKFILRNSTSILPRFQRGHHLVLHKRNAAVCIGDFRSGNEQVNNSNLHIIFQPISEGANEPAVGNVYFRTCGVYGRERTDQPDEEVPDANWYINVAFVAKWLNYSSGRVSIYAAISSYNCGSTPAVQSTYHPETLRARAIVSAGSSSSLSDI